MLGKAVVRIFLSSSEDESPVLVTRPALSAGEYFILGRAETSRDHDDMFPSISNSFIDAASASAAPSDMNNEEAGLWLALVLIARPSDIYNEALLCHRLWIELLQSFPLCV